MVTVKQLSLSAIAATILLTGCASKSTVDKTAQESIIEKEKKMMQERDALRFSAPPPPPISLPSVYEEPTIMSNGKTVSFSATEAPLSKLLYVIAHEAGLNLVVEEDVDVTKLVTLNMKDAPLEDALDITMNISNSYVEIKGNIMHVQKIMSKSFELPFINMAASTSSNLGGDLLGANAQAGSLSGEFTVEYESDDDNGDFYQQLEDSVENLISEEGSYSLNKFSGTLVVSDYRKNVQKIEKVVNNLKKFLSKQILIEAKIMEVILNDSHQLGINWQKAWQNINSSAGTLTLGSNMGGGNLPLTQTANIAAGNAFNSGINTSINSGVATSISYTTKNFETILQAMQTAGSIEVVSNPSLKVINGQSGVLSSGNIIPYWEKEVTYTTTGTGATAVTTPEITYNKIDVLNGISLGVTPVIKENGEVILNVVPVVTTIDGEKSLSDAQGEVATAPIINVKEAGTTVLTKDDDMVVIGGLISTVKKDAEYKTPFAGDVPIAGNLFKRSEKSYEKRELVIILKIDVDERKID